MARLSFDRAREQADQLLKQTEGRRVSVLPAEASEEVSDATTPALIKSKAQLEHWVETNPSGLLVHLAEARYERDMALGCVEQWEAMALEKDKAYELAKKAQERNNVTKQQLNDLKPQLVTL